jgi:uncharacterized Zn finger protein (UPF0148 family)
VSGGGAPLRCRTCGRFRAYRDGDRFCIVCGSETLDAACACGRGFDYALDEPPDGALHCPRCGRDFRGSSADWEAREA